jgi:nucleotide-binding universal stress UspA family protein
MLEWKKICCAVDFAETSRVAMGTAADVAKRFEGELTVLHVLVSPPPGDTDILVSSRGLAAVEAEKAEELLDAWRADAEARAGRPVRSRVLWGDAAAEILRHAGEERCDLVVVGTHGRTGVARLVLGSVAERVARRSPCPVLVVHDHGVLEEEDVADESRQPGRGTPP